MAWFAPMLATAVAFVVVSYLPQLAERPQVRRAFLVLFTLDFVAAAIAGLFESFITVSGEERARQSEHQPRRRHDLGRRAEPRGRAINS